MVGFSGPLGGISGHLWAYLGISGHIWAYLGISGHLCASLGIFQHLWASPLEILQGQHEPPAKAS